jgi:uncharacterized protein with von Willebrand factor type A (vWA) domain
MALFGFGKKNNDTTPVNNTPVNTGNPTLNFNKEIPNTTAGLSLQKSVLSLDKTLITLEKKSGFSFDGHRAKVAVAMDYSGSMSSLYRNGAVQAVLTRLMPLALRFDDNGELDVWLFDNEYRRMPSMDLSNFDSYVDNEILRNRWHMGGTNYAPVLEDMLKKYFKEDAMTANIPTFVIFITDGANADKTQTDRVIRESANKNIFVQFVGIGSASFPYLEKLDDLTGRVVDNTGFIKVSDMARLSDEQLFEMLLEQYPDWLRAKPF